MKPALQIIKSLARLQCTACGAEANALCNCGKPYVPKEVAKQAIVADPSKSNRTIAKETGTSEGTVRNARAELGAQGCAIASA
jgi:FixJ family two-component response regulator